ncbi:MAG: response regulator transcription factor [Candidatus Pseudobacter hemicellulosilyticus]|uniref:Response regulator transcription factor n=1 Tax=Candidatus Pseudobacter hemicellulosilyticus TaxID=3121375 RepID=A0AAJ5WVY9_9BACT|nr:MAG: response regulator transcription factor [Pseudobacter sp.]
MTDHWAGIAPNGEAIRTINHFNKKGKVMKKEAASARLTDRELQVLRLIEQELGNKQIAETLFISERTVETHRKNIFRKTQTSSVIGLIKYAYQHKLV